MKLRYIKLRYILALIITAIVLNSCATKPQSKPDGAPQSPKSVKNIPNAKPKTEAKSRYGNPESYVIRGKRYHVLKSAKGYDQKGVASWYGTKFAGRKTSNGEVYDLYKMTAAHKTLPLPTYAEVKNLENGKKVIVKINDRGPFVGNRIIDLSYAAAKKLGVYKTGTAKVQVTAIDPKKYGKNQKVTPEQMAKQNIYLQVGAFGSRPNAEQLAAILDKMGKASHIHATKQQNIPLYKVKLGPYPSRQAAEAESKRILADHRFSQAMIVDESA